MPPASPVLIGIVGDSGSGKSTLSLCIAQAADPERATLICLDDYHRYGRAERERRGITALNPECNRLDLVADHLAALRQGRAIAKPVYDHHDGTFGPDEVVEPREVIVVRGLLGLHTEALAQCFDLSVFLDPDPDLRVRWKVERDCAKRGYSRDQVMEKISHRRPDADRYIAPQRDRADIVIRFAPGSGPVDETGDIDLDMQITLRRVGEPDDSGLTDGATSGATSGATGGARTNAATPHPASHSPPVARTAAGQRVVPLVLAAAESARDLHATARSRIPSTPPDRHSITP